MPVRTYRGRASRTKRASNDEVRPDNLMALVDQGFFAGQRAAGHEEIMQVVWVYEHPIDFAGLRRFHDNFSRGLLARRIERSTLPFARHRWVSAPETPDIDIAECARSRDQVSDWADERSQLPVDPEWGPGWHLGVLPLTDGSTAVSLVASHYLLDGLGLVSALVEALWGKTRDFGYPPPGSRTRLLAVVEDARQTARDVPEAARALLALAKLTRGQKRDNASSPASHSPGRRSGDGDDPVIVPGVTISVALDDWDSRAKALGGTSSTLAAGLTAKVGQHIGRRRASDGTVTLQLPISQRTEHDTRAIAVSFARVSIDPERVTADLRDARAAIKQALQTARKTPDESLQLAPLAPFTPKRTWKRGIDAALADPDRPVLCSNLGDVGSVVSALDGTHAEYAYARGTRQRATRRSLERAGGQLQVLSFRAPMMGRIFLHVLAYQPGAENTKAALRELAAQALAEFGLAGGIE